MMSEAGQRALLRRLLDAGLARVAPRHCLPPHLPATPPRGRTLVLGAGKAAAAMAASVAEAAPWPVSGLVVTRYGHTVGHAIDGIEVIEAGHPVPDDRSQAAAVRMLAHARGLTPDDRLIFLASGGGSAVLSLPVDGLAFADKQALIRHLVLSGAAIGDINCVRKHVSAIKGGRLAQATAAGEILTYVLSDIPGDDPSDVASGPTLPDRSTLAQARSVIDRFGAPKPELITRLLADPANETLKPRAGSHPCVVIATADDCLAAAQAAAEREGLEVINLGGALQGEANELGREHAALARRVKRDGRRAVILSGGEVTVRVRNRDGAGGPNLEYLAGLARALDGLDGVFALACDTDGIDGSGDAAGGVVTPSTLDRAAAAGQDAAVCLAANRTYRLFSAIDDLIITGPTLTNVNDFRAIVVGP